MVAANKYTYDYTKTMMMKMDISHPDKNGGSKVQLNFVEALDIIEKIDNMTVGVKKIIYLVGWQYLGHDDKYPDFFQVNESLKREQDNCAHDSLLWLIKEAKKHNTIVSFHINFNDAYEDAPSFGEFVINNALIRRKNGKPWALEKYNGKRCYKTSFKEYWESGLFKRQIDKLLSLFPLEEQGTVHVDNFQCYTNYAPDIAIHEMQDYRDKMIGYLRGKGIDITTEFTCREHDQLRNKTLFGVPRDHNPKMPIHILGKMPAVWWLTYLSNQELVDIEPQVLSGGILRNGTKNDKRSTFIYGNIHGEEVFQKYHQGEDIWTKEFLKEFATVQVPYNYLCQHKRLKIDGKKDNMYCQYKNDITSYQKNQKIVVKDKTIKENDNLCMPFVLIPNSLFAFSGNGDSRDWHIINGEFTKAVVHEITKSGKKHLCDKTITNNLIHLDIKANQGLFIELI